MNIFKNIFGKRNKEQTTPDKWINSEVSTITPAFSQPRFNRAIAVNAYTGYWAAALDYNSNAAANGIIRLYSRVSKNGEKCLFSTTQHKNIYQRKYFNEKLEHKPSANVQYKTMNVPEDFEIVQGHPVISLFLKANPMQSTYQFLFEIFLSLEITGDAFIHIVSFTNGTPSQLYVLQSQYMEVISAEPGQGRLIDKYTYKRTLGSPIDYSVDEIIHIKYPSPKKDGLFYGVGKIEKGWATYLLNKFSHEYQIALYANNAVPDYFLINKSGNKISRKRFMRFMRNISGGGPTSRGKVIGVDGDVGIESIAFTPKDLSDVQFNIQEIASISGCPINKLIGNDNIKANSEEQNTSWLRNTIAPMMQLVASSFSEQLLWRYGISDGDAFLAFDTPVPEDIEQKRKLDETYTKIGIVTPNEIRVSMGLDPLGEELDAVYFNGNRLGENNSNVTNQLPTIPDKAIKIPDVVPIELKKELDSIIGSMAPAPIVININNNVEEDENVEDEKNKGLPQDNIEVEDIKTDISSTIANRIKDIV